MTDLAFLPPTLLNSHRHRPQLSTCRHNPLRTPPPSHHTHQTPPTQTSPTVSLFAPINWLKQRFEPRIFDLSKIPPSVPAVQATSLVKRYSRKEKRSKKKKRGEKPQVTELIAVNGLTFSAWRGEILGLLGPNSSGKSTTLRMIATLEYPDSGSIMVNGVDVCEKPRLVREMMGFVAQSAGLDRVLTGREHLEMFADLAHLDRKTKKRHIDALIDVMKLESFIDRQTSAYSGGIKRRLDMAIALLHRPSVLVLDEPTVGLDLESRRVIWEVLQTVRDNGACVLLTSHYLEEVDVLADRVAILSEGKCISQGTPSELKKQLGGDRVSVRLEEFTTVGDAERAAKLIRAKGLASQSFVNKIQNNTIELVVPADDGNVGSHIISTLKGAGYRSLFSFSQSRPSLGDVYLSATGNDFASADMMAEQKRDAKVAKKETMI